MIGGLSADDFRALPFEERKERLMRLTSAERMILQYCWEFWARPSQRIPRKDANERTPDGSWQVWFPKCGRGWGKTRVGAETTRKWIQDFQFVNLVGATADDARDIMIEGESGLLAICPRWERPVYKKSERKLLWPNGAVSLIFTADEPDRARGKQSEKLWADEIAAWRYRDAWDQLMLGLRLGSSPQCVATSTPRPTEMVMEILKDPMTLVTHGSTYENKANLASQFFGRIIKRYEGTRLGRQELDGIVLDDNPHAIFFQNLIDRDRISKDMVPGDLARVAVAIDPAVTATSDSDETGMVIGARDCRPEPHYYIFEDITQTAASPATWARAAVDGYRRRRADVIIGEVNNGGDLVESNIRNADSNVNFVSVRASHGKVIRAEPVGALYEQGRVHHVGKFDVLEKQMTGFDPTIQGQKSPDRMDALVWLLTELSEADTSPEPVTAGARRRML